MEGRARERVILMLLPMLLLFHLLLLLLLQSSAAGPATVVASAPAQKPHGKKAKALVTPIVLAETFQQGIALLAVPVVLFQ